MYAYNSVVKVPVYMQKKSLDVHAHFKENMCCSYFW